MTATTPTTQGPGTEPAPSLHPEPPRGGVTRLAPSPTGALHLGNVRTFLVNWALARKLDWRVLLRIEDLDTPRVKPGAIEDTIDTLAWLGLDWDVGPEIQSDDLSPYRDAMETLATKKLIFPCELSRTEIEQAASAPHRPEGSETRESVYPASLRPAERPADFDRVDVNWRFAAREGAVAFDDRVRGAQSIDVAADVGDFVVWTKRGQPSYQLAVIVDDAHSGVDRVVRGDDLIASTGRQLMLYRALGLEPEPMYWHLPLAVGPDGRRLAKRHGDTRVSSYRASGVGAERIIGLMASWSGVTPDPEPMTAEQFAERFDVTTLPASDIVFKEVDDAWLHSG